MASTPIKRDIPASAGARITVEAATWKGTPYLLNGAGAIKGHGGDCSGTTYKIYSAVQLFYDYQATSSFADYALASRLFRQLGHDDAPQDGDILFWFNHMAIFATFLSDPANATTPRTNAQGYQWTQHNNMWTASRPGGPPYGTAEMRYWRPDPPRIYRYQQ